MGESAGEREIIEGEPFVGLAGGVLNRLLYLLDQDKQAFRIDNTIRCQPPANKLTGMPWEAGAIAHCSQHLDATLAEGHRVVVPMGAAATRRLLGITRGAGFSVEDFHGTCTWDPRGFWVVPTFHPSHLQRGAMNLFGTVLWDLKRALELAAGRWSPAPVPELIVDPSPEWFEAYARGYIAAAEADPLGVWLATDCETPDKAAKLDEGLLGAKDRSFTVTHANFACSCEQGVSVPFIEPYISIIRRMHATLGVKVLHHAKYDKPRYKYQGVPLRGPIYDTMDGWHMIQSDCPRGLGFVATFYCPWAVPWKYLGSGSGVYRAFDGVNTLQVMYGLAEDLQARGMWESYLEDIVDWEEYTVEPLETVGVLVDQEEVREFGGRLRDSAEGFWLDLQGRVPEELKRLSGSGKEGWKKDPGPEKPVETFGKKQVLRPTIEKKVRAMVKVCLTCGAEGGITTKHRCKDKALVPQVVSQEREVSRWFIREDFNPGSSPQMLSLLAWFKDKPGRNKETGRPSADKVTIEELSKHSKNQAAREVYRLTLDYKSVHKVKTTYVDGVLRRFAQDRKEGVYDGRLHPTLTNKPSTMRPSCTAPNLFNVRADKDGKKSLAAGFKKCIVAEEGSVLVELDWVGQEAVFTGWFAGAPRFIRLANLGIHDFFNADVRGVPADESWPDDKLRAYLREIKEKYEDTRDPCKRTVHGKDYGLTPHGMHERFPHIFKTLKMAKEYSARFDKLFPEIHTWQERMLELANKQHYLGGAGQHPFNYLHHFWDVRSFRKISMSALKTRQMRGEGQWAILNGIPYAVQDGGDANRVKAFFPQSTNAAWLRTRCRQLFHPESPQFIGDAFHGRTPLRAPIYDSLLLELPRASVDRVVEIVAGVMLAPERRMPMPKEWGLGDHLAVGVDAKIGKSWGDMEKLSLRGIKAGLLGEAGEDLLLDEEWEEEDDDWGDHGPQDWWVPGAREGGTYEGAEDVPF